MTRYVRINEGVCTYGDMPEAGEVYPVDHESLLGGSVFIKGTNGESYVYGDHEFEDVDPAYVQNSEEGYYEIPEDSADGYEESPDSVAAYLDEDEDEGSAFWKAANKPYTMTFTVVPEVKDPAAPTVAELNGGIDISDYVLTGDSYLGDWQEPEEDLVSAPNHYSAGMPEGIEVMDIIKAQGFWKEFCAGNVIKYSLRWQYKNGLEDLKKMLQYGQWLAEELEDAE